MIFRKNKETDNEKAFQEEPWYDLHSHFLPGVDDGCRTPEESIEVLTFSRRTGIAGIIATPHYYPEESIARFLERRSHAADKLKQALSAGTYQIPAWCLGAEAAYYEGLVQAEGLEQLCLGASRYLLLELPFSPWNHNVIRDLYTLNNLYNITPVIAHLERYLDLQNRNMLQELYEADVLIQMNGGYILDKPRHAGKRIEGNLVQVLGSDCHGMRSRRPNLQDAVKKLKSSGLRERVEELRLMNQTIFEEAMKKKTKPQSPAENA